MSALELFEFGDQQVRSLMVDSEPWFVAADVARILGYSATEAMTRSLEDDEKGMQTLHTLGGTQTLRVVNEPGLYAAIMRSTIPAAQAFKRWVTHEVLPAIRKTGSFVAPQTPEQQIASALVLATGLLEQKDAKIAELEPRAEAWNALASAEGDYSVGDAAKMLARAGIPTGPQRLFGQLRDLRWTFRGGDGAWRAYADRVDRGYLSERPSFHYHPGTGERVVDPPQVRVTAKGIEQLRLRLHSGAARSLVAVNS